jgi:hypothetical protein
MMIIWKTPTAYLTPLVTFNLFDKIGLHVYSWEIVVKQTDMSTNLIQNALLFVHNWVAQLPSSIDQILVTTNTGEQTSHSHYVLICNTSTSKIFGVKTKYHFFIYQEMISLKSTLNKYDNKKLIEFP